MSAASVPTAPVYVPVDIRSEQSSRPSSPVRPSSQKPSPRYVPDRPVKPGQNKEPDKMAGWSDSTCYGDAEGDGENSGPEVPEVEAEPEVMEDISELSDEEYHPRTPPASGQENCRGFRGSVWQNLTTNPGSPSHVEAEPPQVQRHQVPATAQGPRRQHGGGVKAAPAAMTALLTKGGIAPDQHREQSQSSSSSLNARALKDEEMWQARKNVTGAVGRLVYYEKGQRPADDILGLARTPGGHVMVTAVRSAGPAAQAGVTTGHKLVSIDGQKTFLGIPTDDILRGLVGPVSLVFLGFVGKILAEVQVDQPGAPSCGLPEVTDIGLSMVPKNETIELLDATMFQRHDASLLLSTGERDGIAARESTSRSRAPAENDGDDADQEEQLEEEDIDAELVFELQRKDARYLLRNALTASAATTPMFYI
mmetsp:Transcript_50133/g.119332  ORF Transcript_50133/g.119332 Transcript_50133/m.119332 type:complete len:423 (-) Transcript_50133:351-1619(-)